MKTKPSLMKHPIWKLIYFFPSWNSGFALSQQQYENVGRLAALLESGFEFCRFSGNSLWVIFSLGQTQICTLGIQIRNSKIDKNIMALGIGCRNKPWTQGFNQNLISSTGWTTSGPAVVVQAALDSRAACTTTAGPEVVQPVDEIKFWLKHCVQGLFLHPMLSATIFLSIFEFRICIPNFQCSIIE